MLTIRRCFNSFRGVLNLSPFYINFYVILFIPFLLFSTSFIETDCASSEISRTPFVAFFKTVRTTTWNWNNIVSKQFWKSFETVSFQPKQNTLQPHFIYSDVNATGPKLIHNSVLTDRLKDQYVAKSAARLVNTWFPALRIRCSVAVSPLSVVKYVRITFIRKNSVWTL